VCTRVDAQEVVYHAGNQTEKWQGTSLPCSSRDGKRRLRSIVHTSVAQVSTEIGAPFVVPKQCCRKRAKLRVNLCSNHASPPLSNIHTNSGDSPGPSRSSASVRTTSCSAASLRLSSSLPVPSISRALAGWERTASRRRPAFSSHSVYITHDLATVTFDSCQHITRVCKVACVPCCSPLKARRNLGPGPCVAFPIPRG
jgi:hypothetical protein